MRRRAHRETGLSTDKRPAPTVSFREATLQQGRELIDLLDSDQAHDIAKAMLWAFDTGYLVMVVDNLRAGLQKAAARGDVMPSPLLCSTNARCGSRARTGRATGGRGMTLRLFRHTGA
jgi:hypothetical protein